MKKIFITGTDTEVGKTYASVQLLNKFNKAGLTTVGLKPIASGGFIKDGIFYNDDTYQLREASLLKLPYDLITPFSYQPAIPPHLAHSSPELTIANLHHAFDKSLSAINADVCIIEGFGGWYAPLNQQETMADFVMQQRLDVLLVIAIRLGCFNHSLLTLKALRADGVNIIGWIGNCIHPDYTLETETLQSLQSWISAPCVGIISYKKCILPLLNLTDLIN